MAASAGTAGSVAKTKFLQVRVSEEDKARIQRVARAHYIDTSTWARMTIMQAVDAWEGREMKEEKDQGA